MRLRTTTIVLCSVGVVLMVGIYLYNRAQILPQAHIPSVTVSNANEKADLIVLDPQSFGGAIISPLHLSGKARGTWYFEASFPIILLDDRGLEIGRGHATAQSDWMTSEFVPFIADVSFSTPKVRSGTLILKKDNPSGDPARDDSLIIPIIFSTK